MIGIKNAIKEVVVKGHRELASYAGLLCREKSKPEEQPRRCRRRSKQRSISWIGEPLYASL